MERKTLDKNGQNARHIWGLAGFSALVFGCLYVFVTVTSEIGGPAEVLFALVMALAVTAYTLLAGQVLRQRFQITGWALAQVLAIFLMGHFLPFVLDDVGNVHLFYGRDGSKVLAYTLPGLLNFILCFLYLAPGKREPGRMAKGFRTLAVCLALFVNPFQGLILVSLFCVQVFFSLVETIWKNFGKKMPFFKGFLLTHREKLLWVLLWCGALVLALVRGVPVEAEGSRGLFDGLRSFRSSVLNMLPLFHSVVVSINLAAVAVALWSLVRKKEVSFLYWQLEVLFCMGFTAVCLTLFCTQFGERYLVYPEVMLTWMGWLLLMSASSLAYLVKKLPKAGLLLPLLTYMVLCEMVLNYRTYGHYTLPQLAEFMTVWG